MPNSAMSNTSRRTCICQRAWSSAIHTKTYPLLDLGFYAKTIERLPSAAALSVLEKSSPEVAVGDRPSRVPEESRNPATGASDNPCFQHMPLEPCHPPLLLIGSHVCSPVSREAATIKSKTESPFTDGPVSQDRADQTERLRIDRRLDCPIARRVPTAGKGAGECINRQWIHHSGSSIDYYYGALEKLRPFFQLRHDVAFVKIRPLFVYHLLDQDTMALVTKVNRTTQERTP